MTNQQIPVVDPLFEDEPDEVEPSFKEKFLAEITDYYETILREGYCHEVGYPYHRFLSDHKATQNRAICEACARCDVQKECLFYALGRKEFCVWGATTEKFRDSILIEVRKLMSADGDNSFATSIWNERSWTLAKKIAESSVYIPTFNKKYTREVDAV